jgi:DNA-binding response OmpR family regulator
MAIVLVAEDIEPVRAALSVLLQTGGHDVRLVNDGTQALAHINDPTIDLFLLDVWMPGKSGLDVLKALRAAGDVRPVVLMSGGGPGATLEQATAIGDMYGANQTIFKPFDDEELLGIIAKLLTVTSA